jgi:hypothetical protein
VVADLTPGAQVVVTAALDTLITYIPPGVVVDYYWTQEDAAGQRFDTPRAQFRYDDTRVAWQTRTVQGMRLHWQGSRAAFGDLLATTADEAVTTLRAQAGLTMPLPVEVWVYPDEDALRDALPPGEPEWVGGQAFPRLGVVVSLIADDVHAEDEARRVLPHELAHLAVDAATRNPYNAPPLWLSEGLAVNNQQDGDPYLDEILEKAARARALLPLRTLESSFPADPDQALLSYAESASAVHFLLQHYGSERVQRLLTTFQQGMTYDAALQQALGVTVEPLDAAWRATLPQPAGAALDTPTAAASAGVTPSPISSAGAVPESVEDARALEAQIRWWQSLIWAILCIAALLLIVIIMGVWWVRRRASRRA